jgi:hypothetical protein
MLRIGVFLAIILDAKDEVELSAFQPAPAQHSQCARIGN